MRTRSWDHRNKSPSISPSAIRCWGDSRSSNRGDIHHRQLLESFPAYGTIRTSHHRSHHRRLMEWFTLELQITMNLTIGIWRIWWSDRRSSNRGDFTIGDRWRVSPYETFVRSHHRQLIEWFTLELKTGQSAIGDCWRVFTYRTIGTKHHRSHHRRLM